ncbi:MAG: hypothetical protein WCG62_06520 [Actinomycetes bacterium]
MTRPTNAMMSEKLAEMAALVANMPSSTRKHHQLAKVISSVLREQRSLKEQVDRLDGSAETSAIMLGQIRSLEGAVSTISQRLEMLEEGQSELSARVADSARTISAHGDMLDTHSGRLNALESATSGISTAVARAQAQIEALQQGYRFNFLSAAIAAGIGLAVYFFWYVPHSFSGSVLDAHHQATGQIVRSLLDTGWGNAMGLLVVFLFTIGAGYLFARNSASQTRMMASTRAEASVSTRPITRIGSSSGASSDVRGSVDSPTGAH